MSLVFEDIGEPRTHQKITPGDTAVGSLNTNYYYTEWTVAYTSGGTTQIQVGDWITGATSSAIAKVVAVSLTGGTWAGGDAAGVFRLTCCQSSTGAAATWTSGENVKVAGGTNDATITGTPTLAPRSDSNLFPLGIQAKSALVVCYANTALIGVDGGNPDQTALVGTPLVANSSILLKNIKAISNLKAMDYASGFASILQIDYFF